MIEVVTDKFDWKELETSRIENNRDLFSWMGDDRKRHIAISFSIFGAIPEDIKDAFGKHQFRHRGEYYTKCWILKFKGVIFYLVSAKGRGSTVEVETKHMQDTALLKEFVLELLKKLDLEYGEEG